jgi:hypothetical protein
MAFCLIPQKVADFREALKNKDINITDLLGMSHDDLIKTFKPYAGENAEKVAVAFQEKMILKNRVLGIQNLFSKLGEIGKYSPMGKEELAQAISDFKAKQQERIFSPKEYESFLNGLADKKVGFHISEDVATKVFELSSKASSEKNINVDSTGVGKGYWQAQRELNRYVESQKPISTGQAILKNIGTIARNDLLLSPSNIIKVGSNDIVNSTIEKAVRNIASGSLESNVDKNVVSAALNDALGVAKESEANVALKRSIDDVNNLGEGHNFDAPTTGNKETSQSKIMQSIESITRKGAKATNIIIDGHIKLMNAFHIKAFYDSASTISSTMAKDEGLTGSALNNRATEIFKDSAKIEPETEAGKAARFEAQKQAGRILSINDSWLSKVSTGLKKAFNNVPGLGDAIEPMAKIPANLIWNNIENAGVGVGTGLKDMYEGKKLMQSADSADRYDGMAKYAHGTQTLIRTAGIMGTTGLLFGSMPKSSFRRDQYGNNFVKFGNTWINAEYISAINPTLGGIVAYKTGSTPGQKLLSASTLDQYVSGTMQSLKGAPGIDEGYKLATAVAGGSKTAGKYIGDFFASRGVPAFLGQVMSKHPINNLLFGKHGVESQQQVNEDNRAKAAAKTAPTLMDRIRKMGLK